MLVFSPSSNMAAMLTMSLMSLLLARGASGRDRRSPWVDGGRDTTYSHLGFYVRNVMCNTDGTQCSNTYTINDEGREIQQNFTYKKSPYELVFESSAHLGHIVLDMEQGNQDPFRICFEYQSTIPLTNGGVHIHKMRRCVENTFDGVDVPPDCLLPIAAQNVYVKDGDEEIRGTEVLYCAGVND
ncbi:uncharacterized protein LOC119736232 [Patiria miniata]|uniref:Uncharacterized protein n=1 Tax=Patiria miniata TaxID=46514 RepID=A0A914ARX1_PATMI|nr:uncharacterized protein LOC119736232 [Patiria miniata]